MEMKFDPMTGEPIKTDTVPEPEMQFNPMTGEPIKAGTEPEPEMKFDPMTGQPITKQAIPEPEMKFDPMTGKPIGQKKLHVSKKILIPVAIVAAVAVVAVVGIKNGTFLGKSGKVLMATANTFTEQTHLSKELGGLKVLGSDKYTVSFNAKMQEGVVETQFATSSKQKQLCGTLDISGASSVSFLANVNSKELQFEVPDLDEHLFVYNYKDKKDGYLSEELGEDGIEVIDNLIETVYSNKEQKKQTKDVAKIIEDAYKDLEFKQTDKEEFEVNGKDRKCKGYETTVTADKALDLLDDLENYVDENYGAALDETGVSVSNLFSDMRDEFRNMPDVDVTFYIYKNKLACFQMEIDGEDMQLVFHGGDTRTQNMELIIADQTVMKVEGDIDGSEESYELSSQGMTLLAVEYDYKSGDIDIRSAIGYDTIVVSGNLQSDRKGITLNIDEISSGSSSLNMNANITIKKGADFKKTSGEKFDIGNASEKDLQDVIYDLSNSSIGRML